MRQKVVPALFHLHVSGELPSMFRVIGFSRRDLNDQQFREHVRSTLDKHKGETDPSTIESFLALFHFQRGHFDDAQSYEALKATVVLSDEEWGVCANKLFYLSVAPEFYEHILKHLSDAHLTDPCSLNEGPPRLDGSRHVEAGWTRVIVEKPFGVDYESARKLDELLGTLFDERQIYRIDHYLGKEMLQNILIFRFANNLFEVPWGKSLIERIDIRLLEEIGVEKRGAFYDSVGALRDVGQNHLLQMLALITMDHPQGFKSEHVRPKRAEILNALEVPSDDDIRVHSFRAQYDGYREIAGVAPESQTETYFRVRAHITTPRWDGIPIYLEAGKRLGGTLKEIFVTFKHSTPCLCPPGLHHKNGVIIRMEPKEEILIEFWSKKPGLSMVTEERTFHFLLREQSARMQYIEEYKKLLLDCIRGDQTLFISTDEIRAMWRFTDPIVAAWQRGVVPLAHYSPGDKEITK